PKGNTFWSEEKQGSAAGSFWDEFDLPEEADLGYYRIKAVVGGKEFTEDFEVDEYRKPEFKVEIRPGKPRYFAGEKINFLVSTQYYFGAPVEAEISYTVYRSTYYYFSPGEDMPEWLSDDESYGGYGDYVSEGKAKTDRQGQVAIEVPTDASTSDQRYILRLTATDITNRTVTTENGATVTAGDFFFRTETEQFLAFPGKAYPLTVVTKDYDGKPVEQGFEVKIEREVYDRVAQSYEYKKESSVDGKTGANGQAPLQLQFKRGGYYMLTISGEDKAGRKVSYQDYVWVSGNAEDSEDYSYQKQLKLVVDRKKFDAGETAKLFLVGPVKNGKVLVTVEGPRILEYRVVTLDGFSKQVDLPLKKEWIPNVFVSAALIGNKEYYDGQAEFQISPKEHYLTVEIKPDAALYRPAGNINYTISTKSADGQPAPAELSLGVVDESLYALKADSTNIKQFFWGPRPNRVMGNYSFSGWYSGGIEKEDQNQLRRNFKDTAYWAPMLQTSPDGQATASFTLPDNLTTWRATVLAHTPATAVGQQINQVISSKDLIVRLATPRFFTERDKVVLKAIVHNYTDQPQTVQVSLGAEGIDFASAKDGENRSLTIEPKGAQSFDFTMLPKMAGSAKLQLLAKNAAVSDGIELKIPVLPHGIADHQYAQGEVEAASSGQVPLMVTPQTDPKRAKLKVTLDTSFVAQLLGSLTYLVDYPYGCVEQTMSRLLPAITISRLYESLGLSDPMLEKKLPKVIAKGLKRIVSFQHSDGGWGWWKQDNTDPYMTAYAMYGLIRAKQLGETVPDSVIENGKEALKNLLKAGTTSTNSYMLGTEATKYFIHYVASLAGVENTPPQPRSAGFKDRMAESMLVLALQAQGNNDRAEYWRQDLTKSVQCQGGLCRVPSGDSANRYYDDTETTAWGLLALLSGPDSDPILKDGMARWLLTQRRGGLWRHTRATATVLYALTDYAKGQPGVKSGVNGTLTLNGELLEKIAVAAAHFVRNVQQPKLKTGNNDLVIGNLLTTPLYYQTDFTTFSQQENLAPVTQGIKVTREYVSLGDVTEDSAGKRSFKAEALKGKVKKGQIIGVRLTVESAEDLAYVVIEDPFPSGFEVVEGITFDPKVEYYADSEKRDEKIAYFANYLGKGTHVYNYGLRPELAGTFHVMPTEASEMYRPEVRGAGGENVMEV
ncbi:MAG TPA: alpha-2-macroglobulin family protein, partial [bacterium]|nr:alpha-2-macroglobulin family protein [bacterium]